MANLTQSDELLVKQLFGTDRPAGQRVVDALNAAPIGGGLISFQGRATAAAVLLLADVTGVGGAPIANPTFTGVPAAPTAAALTSTTQIATTAFVTAAITAAGGNFLLATGATLGATASIQRFTNGVSTPIITSPVGGGFSLQLLSPDAGSSVVITGSQDVALTASVGNVSFTPAAQITGTAGTLISLTSTTTTTLTSGTNFGIVATAGNVSVTASLDLDLTGVAGNVIFGVLGLKTNLINDNGDNLVINQLSTTKAIDIRSLDSDITINSGAGVGIQTQNNGNIDLGTQGTGIIRSNGNDTFTGTLAAAIAAGTKVVVNGLICDP